MFYVLEWVSNLQPVTFTVTHLYSCAMTGIIYWYIICIICILLDYWGKEGGGNLVLGNATQGKKLIPENKNQIHNCHACSQTLGYCDVTASAYSLTS